MRDLGEGVHGAGGNTEFDGGERDDDVEAFFEDAIFFDQALDELAIFNNCFLDFCDWTSCILWSSSSMYSETSFLWERMRI